MPIYTSGGKTYNIPDEKAEKFEASHPDAKVTIYTGGKRYNIPIGKQSKFKAQFAEWSYDQPSQPTAPQTKPVATTMAAQASMQPQVEQKPTNVPTQPTVNTEGSNMVDSAREYANANAQAQLMEDSGKVAETMAKQPLVKSDTTTPDSNVQNMPVEPVKVQPKQNTLVDTDEINEQYAPDKVLGIEDEVSSLDDAPKQEHEPLSEEDAEYTRKYIQEHEGYDIYEYIPDTFKVANEGKTETQIIAEWFNIANESKHQYLQQQQTQEMEKAEVADSLMRSQQNWLPEEAAAWRAKTIAQTGHDPLKDVPQTFVAKFPEGTSEDEIYWAWTHENDASKDEWEQKDKTLYVDNIYTRAKAKQQEELKAENAAPSSYPTTMTGAIGTGVAKGLEDTRRLSTQTIRAIDKANELLEAYKAHQGDENFFVGAFKGFRDGISDIDNWVGVYMLGQMTALQDIMAKQEAGEELTQEEQDLVDALAYQMAVEASVADELGWGYTSGKTTGASLPFMLQMIASPATSATNAALKGLDKVAVFLGKNAVKKFGRSVLKKMLSKKATRAVVRGLYKVGKSKVGKAVAATVTGTPRAMIEGSIQTVLFHTDRVTADAIDRQMGNEMLVERANELFGTQMEAREGKEWTRSVLEAFATQASENVTEYLGTRVFAPIGGMIGRALAPLEAKAVGTMFKVADKMGVGDVMYRLVNLPKSQFLTGLAGRGQWNGLFGEYLEEVVNNGVNVLLGNMDAEDFVSLEQNAETLLGLAWTSLGFGVANGVSRVKQYAKAQEDINHVLRAAELAWADNKQEWESWKARIDEMSYDELREEMRRLIVANSMATAEQRGIARERTRLAMQYMLCRSQLMGLDATSEELREASTRTPSWLQAEDAQADGIVADEEGQADIVAELTEAHQVLTEASGMDAQAFVGQYGQSADEQLRHIDESPLDANTKAAAKAYILANERYEGVAAVAEAEIERKVRAAEEEVRANINPETNTAIRVSMKTGNEEGKVIDVEAYVIAGNINESGAVTLRMADGSQQMVQANKLTLVSETEADILLEGAREAARQEAVAEVAGRMSNHVASQAEMPMEVGHRVVVNGEHGSIVATDGQVTRVQLDNGTEVDFTAEAVYDEAQYNKVSERSARAKEHVAEVVVNDKRSNEVPTPMRAPKAEAQIPTDTNGAKQYDQADPQVAWESILAKAKGNAKVAQAVIAEEIEILQSQVQALEQASIPVVENMDQRIEMHMQRQAEIDAINDKIARWQEVAMYAAEQERINRLIPTLDDVSTGETTAEEFVAGLFGAKGIRITPDSFRRETGLGTEEQRRLVGIIAGKDKGGVSIERAAEIIMDNYSAELEARGFTGDSSDLRGIIIDILSSGNPRSYAKQASLMRAEEELSQMMQDFDRYTQEAYRMSAEEYIMYEESRLPMYIEQYKGFDEIEFFNNFVDEIENYENYDTSRESTATSGSSEVLHQEQPSITRGDRIATEGEQGRTLQSNVQGEAQNGPSLESPQQIAKEHNAQIDVARLAEETGVSEEEIRQVIDFANKVGVKLNFAEYTTTEQGDLTNGEAYASRREITISKLMLAEGKSLRWIMGHELTHIVKTQGTQEEWEAFRDFIKNTIGEKSWNEGIESRTKLYKEAYKNQSVAGFEAAMEEELCADQAGYIFFDASNIDRFLGVPRTLAQKIYDWFRGLVSNVPNNVKVAVELWGQMAQGNVEVSTDEEGKKHSIVGVTGARALDKAEGTTVRMDNMDLAEEMEAAGKDAETIWMATGWERGVDGKWKYDIMDYIPEFVDQTSKKQVYEDLIDAKTKEYEAATNPTEKHELRMKIGEYMDKSAELSQYFVADILGEDHPLIKAYPDLGNITIEFNPNTEDCGYYPVIEQIELGTKNEDAKQNARNLAHELQHAIQHAEGFARGGNISSANVKIEEVKNILGINDKASINDIITYLEHGLETPSQNNALTDLAKKEGYDNAIDYVSSLNPLGYYYRLAGEVESRNASTRQDMTPEERRQTPPSKTEDIDRDNQEVKYSVTPEERQVMANRINEWLKQEDIEWAEGKDLQDIINKYGNDLEAVAVIPSEVANFLETQDKYLYSGRGYFLDHAANHHPEVTKEEYAKMQDVIENYDDIKDLSDENRKKIAFVKKLDKGYAVVAELSNENGKVLLHKTFFYRDSKSTRVPYKNKPSIKDKLSVDGSTTISPVTSNSRQTPNISALDNSVSKDTQSVSTEQAKAEENSANVAESNVEVTKEEVANDKKFSINDNNVASHIYNMDATRVWMWVLRNSPKGVRAKGYGYIDKDRLEEFQDWYDIYLDRGAEEYIQALEELKNKATRKAQEYIDEVIAGVEKHRDDFRRLAEGDDSVLSTSNAAKFSISAESQRIFDTAKAEYGTTEDFGLAGYMLPDGDLLDFSNGSGARTLDHRTIGRVYPDVEHDSRWEYVVDFMNEGAIRLVPESGIIQMTQQPTLEQRKKLKEYIRQENGYVIVEINDANGNSQAYKEYDEGTTPNNVLADIDRYFDEGIRFSLSAEEQSIVEAAKADGTYMKAPNGEPSNLNEKQWAQVRTKAFKEWFGDWEKILRIEKLRGSNPIVVEFNGEYELNRDSAKQWMKDNLRGEYINADTGEKILLSKVGINEVTAHGSKDEAHLKSLSAIPSMIEGAVFIDELVNSKGHDKYDSYRYYVCGLVIDGVDYTAKIVVGVKDGSRYYDHRLTEIEKGTLLDNLNGLSNSVVDMQNTSSSVGKDTKLISILQTNSSKIVDENGEPMVVYHYTPNEFTEFDTEKIGSSTDVGAFGTGFYLSPSDGFSLYGDKKMALFVNAKNPMRLNDSNAFDAKEPFFKKDYEWTKESAQAFADDVQAKGYDAVYYENRGRDEIIVFSPNQIKSATENNGEFSGENNDIRYSISTYHGSGAKFSITAEHKQKQLDIISESNPAENDISTWIRTVDDIKSFEEALNEPGYADFKGEDLDPSYTWDMIEEALQSGRITVYSSKPIKNGNFVTPSRMEAESYAGNGKVYKATLPLQDIAWIDPTQGQVAKVDETKFSISAKQDAEYMAAVEAGDITKAQQMVDNALADAGYTIRGEHGTTHKFTIFSNINANIENSFGKGFYFTSNREDAEANYASDNGPDLTNRIELLAERMEFEDGYEDMDYDERIAEARKRLSGGENLIISAALRMENPCVFSYDPEGKYQETIFDLIEDYDEETDEYGEPTGLLVDFVNSLNEVLATGEYWGADMIDAYELLSDVDYTADQLKSKMDEMLVDIQDEDGNLASSEIFRAALERMGFDGIIDNAPSLRFRNMGLSRDTKHYIVFSSNQVKQSDAVTYDNEGNVIPLSERANAENADIRYSMPADILAANERFNEELDEFKAKTHKGLLHLGKPGAILRAIGVDADEMTLSPSVLSRHLKKHNLTADDLIGLPLSVQTPILAYRHGDKNPNLVVVTEMDVKGGKLSVSLELDENGHVVEIDNIRSVHSKDATKEMARLGAMREGELEKALRWVEKEEVQDWLGIADLNRPIHTINPELSSVANILLSFQNPPLPDDESSQKQANAKSGEQKYSISPIPGRMHGESFIDYAHRVAAEVERQRQWQRTGLQRALALNQYEERVASGWYQTQEALQDSMLGLKALMQSVMGKDTYIEDIPDHENPYLGENRLSSVNQAEAELFAKLMVKPMLEEVSKLARNDEALEELTDYVMAKHGLERNLMMAAKEAQEMFGKKGNTRSMADLYSECRKKDYAGLTALTGEGKVADAEAKAQDMVDAYEAAHYTDAMWDKINALNNAILLKQKESGLLSEKTYQEIRGMYDYYIPLRGFDETTIMDVYAYLDTTPMKEGPVQMRAKGRRSKADSPWAYMQSMAEQVIMQGNRNTLVKQRLLNFVMNHPSDAVSISRVWLKYNPDTNKWEMQRPTFDGNETEQEKAAKWVEFASDMEDLSKQHPSLYKTGKEAVKMKYKVPSQDMLGEHQVLVRTAVGDFVITVQGNPRAAQAANGQTNPDNPQGWMARPIRYAESINRHLSNVYTSANPDFVYSNWVRDSLFGNTMVWIKESPRYAAKFHLNWMKYNPVRVNNLLNKWENNELDMSDPTEAMFYDFMVNGGETGYTSVRDIEAHKDAIKKELKKVNSGVVRSVLSALIDKLTNIARGVENGTRFAAYVTSMEEGRGIGRSIWDAKEISVNFNKKGAGARFVDKEGQTVIGNAAGVVSGFGRSMHVFWNAALQGTTNFGRQAKRHPIKALTALSTMYGLGYLVAMASAWDDDDDKKEGELGYLDIPEYTRRSNIVIKTVAGHWLIVPLPIEYRAVYGMGELCATVMSGKVRMSDGELAGEMAKMVAQAVLPVDIFAGDTWWWNVITPSSFAPIVSAYRNVSWTGTPIYKESQFNEAYPEWTKAYKGADRHLVEATRWLSDATGGNKSKPGRVDLNPAQIEYILDGYLGGWSTTTKNLVKTGEMVLGKREYDARNIPIWRRMFTMANEHTENRNANEMYWRVKHIYDDVARLQRDYKKYIKNGESEYIEKLNALRESQDFKVYQKLDQHMSHINDLNRRIKEAKEQGNSEEEKNANVEFMILKKRIAEEINKMLDDARNI